MKYSAEVESENRNKSPRNDFLRNLQCVGIIQRDADILLYGQICVRLIDADGESERRHADQVRSRNVSRLEGSLVLVESHHLHPVCHTHTHTHALTHTLLRAANESKRMGLCVTHISGQCSRDRLQRRDCVKITMHDFT